MPRKAYFSMMNREGGMIRRLKKWGERRWLFGDREYRELKLSTDHEHTSVIVIVVNIKPNTPS
jgi:hypothetical protein